MGSKRCAKCTASTGRGSVSISCWSPRGARHRSTSSFTTGGGTSSGACRAERHPDIAQALDYLEANKPEENQTALCWGDSRLANEIFDGLECAAVLDWEMARIGDPVQDLAWWLASDRCFSEGLELERLPGIPSHEETVARWKEATGLDTSNLAYYSILALARFSMNMARIAQYMKKIEIIDEENEFDYENLASITLRRALSEL